MKVLSASRPVRVLLFVLLALGLVAIVLPYTEFYREWRFEGKAKIREGGIQAEVVNCLARQTVSRLHHPLRVDLLRKYGSVSRTWR